jgi:dynactin complex subunit
MNTNQMQTFSEKTAWEMGLLAINMQPELESFQARIKELNEELSKKDRIITFLRKDRETLMDENERLEVELEKNLTALRQRQKRKMSMF